MAVVTFNGKDLLEKLRKLPAKMDKLEADVLNDVSFYARTKVQQEMKNKLHEPTKYTINSVLVEKAKPEQKEKFTEVFINYYAVKFLNPLVAGGQRKNKGYEAALIDSGVLKPNQQTFYHPSERDNRGNLKGGGQRIKKMLSALQSGDPYQWSTDPKKKAKYAVMRRKSDGKPFAIAENQNISALSGKGIRPKFMILFTDKQQYKQKTFEFYETIDAAFDKKIDEIFQKHYDKLTL